MNYSRWTRIAVCTVAMGGVLLGSAAGAAASDASIKAVIKSYNSRILVTEGHTVTAIGAYEKNGNPTPVKQALSKSITVLSSLKAKIAAQSASTHRVREAKSKFEQGLQSVIVAYERLKSAFGEKKANPTAAKAEAKKALAAIKRGRLQLREGAKLLT
jgi:hypothetical protein